MSSLELLHNEKVVQLLEQIDTDIKDILEPSEKDTATFMKIILIVETLLTNKKHKNSHIGRFFNRWYDKQPVIDEITEDLKMKEVKKKDIEYKIEELQAEIEKLKWEPEKITEEIEKLKWEPIRLKDWIEESSYPIDKNNIEGFIFDKLKEELIDKNKLNYNYGKEE
tara:strand:- start:137 stop:637 length:501 start_codon:yes stop_codon:yes gene_type:complete